MDFDEFPAVALGEYICPVPDIKVLVVDGNLTCLASVSKILRTLGYGVVTASLASEALSIIEEKKNELHLVLVEVHLPDMEINGFAEKIREISHLPYCFMMADDYVFFTTRALCTGAKQYFKNPIITYDLQNLWKFATWKSENRIIATEDVKGFGWHKPKEKETIGTGEQSLQSAKRKDQEHDTRGAQIESLVSKRKRLDYDLPMKFLGGVESAGIGAPPNQKHQLMNVPEHSTGNGSNYLQTQHQSLKQEAHPMQQHSNIHSSLNLGSQHQSPIKYDEGKWPVFIEQPGVTHNPLSQGYCQIYVCNCMYLESHCSSIFPCRKISHVETSAFGKNQLDVLWELQGVANNTSGSSENTANGKGFNGSAFIYCVDDPCEQNEMEFLTPLANDVCQEFPPLGPLLPVFLLPLDEEHGNFGVETEKFDEIFYSTKGTQQYSDEYLKIWLSSLPRYEQRSAE